MLPIIFLAFMDFKESRLDFNSKCPILVSSTFKIRKIQELLHFSMIAKYFSNPFDYDYILA